MAIQPRPTAGARLYTLPRAGSHSSFISSPQPLAVLALFFSCSRHVFGAYARWASEA